jgi:hypothetical protein
LITQFDDESPKLTINFLISYTVAPISGCCMEKWIMKYGRWFHNYRLITYMLESVGRWTCQDILFSPSSPRCDLVIFIVSATALVLLFYHIWLLKWKRKPYLSFDFIKHTMQTMERLRSHETGLFKKPSDLMQIFKVRCFLLVFSNMNIFLLLDWTLLNGMI